LRMTDTIAFTAGGLSRAFGGVLTAIVVLFFVWLFNRGQWTPDERRRLWVIAVLFVGAAVFWSLFGQGGSTVPLFAGRSTRNEIFGVKFGSGSWQAVNSSWVVILSPVFAWIWIKLGRHNPSSPVKFALGLFFAAMSFAIMVPAASMAAGGERVGW